jgi:hypothetical protein
MGLLKIRARTPFSKMTDYGLDDYNLIPGRDIF